MQVMAEHPSGHKGRAFMGAQDALRAMNTEFVPPTATSIVKATENAPEMGPRGLAISAALYNHNPELIQWQLVLGAVRRGVEHKRVVEEHFAMADAVILLAVCRSYAYPI